MAFAIRPADPADAPTLTRIQDHAIRALGSTAYDPAQVDAWATTVTDTPFPFDTPNKHLLVADDAGDINGFVQLDTYSGRIDMLFVRPDTTRQGIGSHLLDAGEAELQTADHYASQGSVPLNAVPFCHQCGYTITRRQTIHPRTASVSYEVCQMQKQLQLPLGGDPSGQSTET